MNIVRYSNDDLVQSLRGEMDRLFEEIFEPRHYSAPHNVSGPAICAWENEECAFIEAELPGMAMEDLELTVQGNELVLRGERKIPAESGTAFHRRERSSGKFARALRLPYDVDAGRVEALLKNGILTIRLPKAEAARPRRIPVTQ